VNGLPAQHDRDVSFRMAEKDDLSEVAVVAQCLDNQWVSPTLLTEMMARGLRLSDVTERRTREIRSEYLRALIAAQQVVVNRSFLFNSEPVYRDYVAPGGDRDAFRHLLSSGVIVPFLFTEDSPAVRPSHDMDERAFKGWLDLIRDTEPTCVRLSWDDEVNQAEITQNLQRRFVEFARVVDERDAEVFVRHLPGTTAEPAALLGRLGEVADWAMRNRGKVRRDSLYREFIVADGTNVADGCYDRTKPFAAEIKQLFDLQYNVALPDALDRFPLRPSESVDRAALQELSQRARPVSARDAGHRIEPLLRPLAYDALTDALMLETLHPLDLTDIVEARRTDEWHRYVQGLGGLLADPLSFEQRVGGIYQHYVEMVQLLAGRAAQRHRDAVVNRWQPKVSIAIEVAGGVLEATLLNQVGIDTNLGFRVASDVVRGVARRAANVVVRLVISDRTQRRADDQVELSATIMQFRVANAVAAFEEIRGQVEEAFGGRALDAPASGNRGGLDPAEPPEAAE
jgi:hypothetical protein